MIKVRKSGERGHANHGWLDTHYTFSFNTYYNPQFMGFRDLRVINEDYISGGQGFGTHGHKDMEILTTVISGALEHRDSTGGKGVIRPHEWQRMTAGTGVRHSEVNASADETVHLLQIWILPEAENLAPGYEQKTFSPEDKTGRLLLVASPDGGQNSLKINQNVRLYNAILPAESELLQQLEPGRYAWIQIIKGSLEVNELMLQAGDGAAVTKEELLILRSRSGSEFLLFDLV